MAVPVSRPLAVASVTDRYDDVMAIAVDRVLDRDLRWEGGDL